MLFIAYYTENTPYEKEAGELSSNLSDLGLELDLRAVPNLGSWQANTQYKAWFVRDMLSKHGCPLTYIDVDARVLACPSLLYRLQGQTPPIDIAATMFKERELLSGTVYFGNTPMCRRVVDLWIELCEKYPKSFPAGVLSYHPKGGAAWDQRILCMAIDYLKPNFYELPPEYCYIHDLSKKRYPDVKPIILHTAASRRYKRFIKPSATIFVPPNQPKEISNDV